ncbi:MAG: alpha/beta fold hydrolase [bacterium]|nr:alpha/beta fold hydrolase [bacterium]
MKKQVVVIHGGRTFDTYEQYIWSLENREVDVEKFKFHKSWREGLEQDLGADFEVFAPKMPNPNNAVYHEWKIWFERMADFLQDDVILIGHSLGGIFLAQYLSENIFTKKVKAVFLVAAPFDDVQAEEFLTSFQLPTSLENFSAQAPNIYLVFSEDDTVVPFTEVAKYKNALPGAQIVAFKNRQHFNQESFFELVELIKKI